jgi:general secretion pathway protein G
MSSRATKLGSMRPRSKKDSRRGFTMLELIIVISIMAILVSIAVPNFTTTIKQSREAVLRQNLFTLRDVISQYELDKQKYPQSLDDLVQAGYMKQLPKDPITGQPDWVPEQASEDTIMSPDQQSDEGGIDDVHSSSALTGSDGKPYSEW